MSESTTLHHRRHEKENGKSSQEQIPESNSVGSWTLHQLWRYDEVPLMFREPFILTSYRPPKCSLSECVIGSVWPWHNETWNIWTHLIPGLYFIGLLLYLLIHENSAKFITSPMGLPLVIFLGTSGGYGLLSGAAHLFNTLSMHARHIAFTFDYLAISLYSYGCAAAYRAYSFPREGKSINEDEDVTAMSYLPVALFFAAASHLVACYTRLAPNPNPLIIHSGRFFAYVLPYFFVTWPVKYRFIKWFLTGETFGYGNIGIAQHEIHFIFSFLSGLFYLSHIPERFAPGKFDIFGHSHQIFHLCSTAATQFQLDAFLEDFRAKKCFVDDSIPGTVATNWPCDPGTNFDAEESPVSPSFLSSSIIGLVVHNLLACSVLATVVVPRVVERHRHHHGHHPRHHRHRKHRNDSSPKESSLRESINAAVRHLKNKILRMGSFRHRQ